MVLSDKVVAMAVNNGEVQSSKDDLQGLIGQKRRHLHKLKEQEAAFGLHTPPYILIQIEDLEEEIEDLLVQLEDLSHGGPNGSSGWQVLVVNTDHHWLEIISTAITLLGGTTIDYCSVPVEEYAETVAACQVAVVDALAPPEQNLSANEWVEQMTQLSRQLPIILLSSWNDRAAAISLRQTLLKNDNNVTMTTIFKENFDAYWFSQVIHQILTR
jgi:hypothetical protein